MFLGERRNIPSIKVERIPESHQKDMLPMKRFLPSCAGCRSRFYSSADARYDI
jgi:hypothetical protein